MEKIGYKVLTTDRMSIISNKNEGGIHYPKNVEVKPKPNNGPLCVFDSRVAALNFAKWLYCCIIVKCNYTKSTETTIWTLVGHNIPTLKVPLCNLPYETILADSVTCLE